MRDPVQATQTVQWIDETGDKANDIVVPAGIVDPGPEDKFLALVRRSARDHCDEDDKPADL